jgi:hypothetical protein
MRTGNYLTHTETHTWRVVNDRLATYQNVRATGGIADAEDLGKLFEGKTHARSAPRRHGEGYLAQIGDPPFRARPDERHLALHPFRHADAAAS